MDLCGPICITTNLLRGVNGKEVTSSVIVDDLLSIQNCGLSFKVLSALSEESTVLELEFFTPVPAVSVGSPSSTTVDQDAPSPSNSQTTPKTQPLIIPNDVLLLGCGKKEAKTVHDIEELHLWVSKYLKGTVNWGLWYLKDSSIALTAFVDVDHAGYQDTHRSTSGSMQFLRDRLVSWSSKRQKSVAISSTKAEYIAMSKHIDIRFYFSKEHVENGVIELYFVNTEYQLADIFIIALATNS
ncbi:hypothetical protein Tco_1418472 [Tanacetum coccineum]